YRWDELPAAQVITRFIGFCVEALAVYFGLRFALGEHVAYAEFNDFHLNLVSFNSYFYFFILFAAITPPALAGFWSKPKFLRLSSFFFLFFFLFYFFFPFFQGPRLFLLLFPLMIALALASWLAPSPAVFETENKSGGVVLKNPKLWYVALFILF